MCLAQGHNAVTPVRLKPAAPRSPVKHTALPFYVATMPLTKFQFNPTHVIREMLFEELPDGSIDDHHGHFSNSKSPCGPNVSLQVSVQLNEWFGSRCPVKNSKMAAVAW